MERKPHLNSYESIQRSQDRKKYVRIKAHNSWVNSFLEIWKNVLSQFMRQLCNEYIEKQKIGMMSLTC